MDYKEHIEEQKLKRLSWISEDIKDMKDSFAEFMKFLKSGKFDSIIDLPKDCNDEIWTGNESRYVLEDEPMENCRFMDGLLWNGHEWFIFSQSANGENWGVVECNKAKHYLRKDANA